MMAGIAAACAAAHEEDLEELLKWIAKNPVIPESQIKEQYGAFDSEELLEELKERGAVTFKDGIARCDFDVFQENDIASTSISSKWFFGILGIVTGSVAIVGFVIWLFMR